MKIVAGRMKCETKKRMANMMYSVVNDGGEGVIARKPKSFYEHGRSQQLFKIKVLITSIIINNNDNINDNDNDNIIVIIINLNICRHLVEIKKRS